MRETIAAARAKLAQEQAKTKTIRGGQEDEREAFIGSGAPGVRKSPPVARRPTEVEILGHVQKSIKSLIANAKGSGKEDKPSLWCLTRCAGCYPMLFSTQQWCYVPGTLFRHHQYIQPGADRGST